MRVKIGEYQITTIFTGEPWCQNCYLVKCLATQELVLLDPGDDAQQIIEHVYDQKGTLTSILITHAHHDHVLALEDVAREFQVSCYVHQADTRLLRQAHTYALVFDKRQIKPIKVPCKHFDRSLKIGQRRIRVIDTPGHTPGSVCFDFGDFIFTGDLVLFQHVGRSDTPGSDMEQLRASLGSLLEQLQDETVIFPGHGRAWTVGEARVWWQDAAGVLPEYKRFGGIE